MKNIEIIAAILEWLYLNDKAFDSIQEWRVAFIKHLKGIIYSKRKEKK